ncbi:MAG: hypothetical protein ACJ76V_09745 [Thermoleophilaceae bacterium]
MPVAALLALGLTVFVVAVTDASDSAAAPSPIVVTRDDSRIPSRCRPLKVAQRLSSLFEAVKDGDRRAIDRSLGIRSFRWYSMGSVGTSGRDFFVTHDRSSAIRHLAARARKHERLELGEVSVGFDRARYLGHFELKGSRVADDLDRLGVPRYLEAKGAIECHSGRLAVFSGSTQAGNATLGALCPEPPPEADPAIVACARRSATR